MCKISPSGTEGTRCQLYRGLVTFLSIKTDRGVGGMGIGEGNC